MSDENTSKTETERALEEALAPIKKIDNALSMREAHLINELEEVRAERKRLRGVLHAIEPAEPKPQKAQRGEPVSYNVSPKVIQEVAAVVAGLTGEYTTNDVTKLLPTSRSGQTVRAALIVLRDRGDVRMTGIRGNGGAKHFRTTPKGRETIERHLVGVQSGNGAEATS